MAKRIIEHITDDIDGTSEATTVTFSFEGKSYEIDLSEKNKDELANALTPYIRAARAVSVPRRTGARTSTSPRRTDTGTIREWAKAHGHSVSERGRISSDVLKAYEAAH